MTRKAKLVVFDNDLKVKVAKYPISDSGDKIRVKSGGESHFMPSIDTSSYLEFPKKFLFFTVGYEKVYFARKLSKKCVDFKTEVIAGPDPEVVKEAAGATMLKDIGKSKQETSMVQWVTLAIVLFTLLNVLGVV